VRAFKRHVRPVAGAAVCALSAWAAYEWVCLKRTPALSAESARAGITVRYTQAGPYRMFSRHASNNSGEYAKRLPVVLVHGLVISSRYMEPLALALRDDFDVHAPDLPGFGESAMRTGALSIRDLADALRMWLAARGIEKAMFIGNSFGCQILAEFAALYPETVDRLVLQGVTVDRHGRTLLTQMWRDRRNGKLEQVRSSASIGRIDYAKAGIMRALATMNVLIRDRIERKLARIPAPTLVVAGTRDPVAPLAGRRKSRRAFPTAR
jgi:pimeloyl-ACP methyl ester carboxylesterase